MIEAAALLVIIAGLVRPKWVRNKRAFGIAIILLVGCVAIYQLIGWTCSLPTTYHQYAWDPQRMVGPCLGMVIMLAQIGYIIGLLVAFWPGGGLFEMGESGADKEASAAGESQSRQE